MRARIYKTAVAAVFVVAAVYLSAVGYLFLFQRDYVFEPDGALALPAEKGLSDVEVIALRAADGTSLTGWYKAAEPGRPTILYFHGNSGNVSGRAKRFSQVVASGFGLLAMSYRGYPGSDGAPSEAALVSDGLETFDWLAARSDAIVIHGESLGTGVAVQVAAERDATALVLEAPYVAALDIAAATYPWVPVGFLMRDPFLSREHVQRVTEPVLIIHGTDDEVIPVENGRRLFEFAHEPKSLAIVDGATHSDLWDNGLWPMVLKFLDDEAGVSAEAASAPGAPP